MWMQLIIKTRVKIRRIMSWTKKKGFHQISPLQTTFMWHMLLWSENSFGVCCRQSFNEIGISTAANDNRLFRDEIPNRISILNWLREMRVAQVTIRKKHTMSQSHSNLNLIILARGLRFWYSGSHSILVHIRSTVLFSASKLIKLINGCQILYCLIYQKNIARFICNIKPNVV